MNNFKIKLLKKITDNIITWTIAKKNIHEIAIGALVHSPQEIEKINNYLENLDAKSKKLGLTHLEKMEKKYLLYIKQKMKIYQDSNNKPK